MSSSVSPEQHLEASPTTDDRLEQPDVGFCRQDAEVLLDYNELKSHSIIELGKYITSILPGFADQIARTCFPHHISDGDRREISSKIESILDDVPEVQAIAELRDQLASERPIAKTLYPGRRSGVDPIQFLEQNYSEELSDGRLGPGILQAIDASLYASVRSRLESQNPPVSIGEFLAKYAPPEKREPTTARKARACALILGTSEERAARFLNSLRPERFVDLAAKPARGR